MTNKDLNKLTEEQLEQVTGGSTRQTKALKKALYKYGVTDTKNITDTRLVKILDHNGISATLHDGSEINSYYRKGISLSQAEVMTMIENGEITYDQ